MANILGNFIKGKDGVNVAAQGAGSGSGTPNVRPANANISNIQTSGRPGGQTTRTPSNSTAAQLARERAEAAKAQIEMRKAAEAARKEEQLKEKGIDASDKKEITPVGLKPPIKRPKSASVNHAQYIAEQQNAAEGEGKPVIERVPQPGRSAAQSALAVAQSVALRAQNEERRANQKAKGAAAKVVEARSAVTAAEEALIAARKTEEATIAKEAAAKEATLKAVARAEEARAAATKAEELAKAAIAKAEEEEKAAAALTA